MAFWKRIKLQLTGKWYPKAITIGKPVTTDQVAAYLSEQSTVSRADVYAVLKDIGPALAHYMAQGRTVKLEGLGTFYYTLDTSGRGVDSREQVSSEQIQGVRVRFIPEVTRNVANQIASSSLITPELFWEEWLGKDKQAGHVSSGNSD